MKPEAVIFVGAQATGKSSFYRERFMDSHVRINLDMLKTRSRERKLVDCCIESRQSFVVDNTNPTKEDRQRYLERIPKTEFTIVCYYFQSRLEDITRRNEQRSGTAAVPLKGVLSTYKRLELPTMAEGFDRIVSVEMSGPGGFLTTDWNDETAAAAAAVRAAADAGK